jgi:hypothetical protein
MGQARGARWLPRLSGVVLVGMLAAGCSPAPAPDGEADGPSATPVLGDGATPVPPSSTPHPATPSDPATDADRLADRAAGVLARDVPNRGTGETTVVPGTSAAPGEGRLRRIRVSVEGGLPVDGAAFADFVLTTLNDKRSWAHDGFAFARTDGDADTEVVLASPELSAELCRPLRTMGTLSCRNGDKVVLTWYRWVNGQQDFGSDDAGLTTYRQYVVNHEVGHSLGHGHVSCPGAGQPAPVMMQQTKGVTPCVANAWPYP